MEQPQPTKPQQPGAMAQAIAARWGGGDATKFALAAVGGLWRGK